MTLKQLKRKYMTEGFKQGMKYALHEGWSYRRSGPDRHTAPNRFSREEWQLIMQTFRDAAQDCIDEFGSADFETVADHWGQIYIDELVDNGISPRRLYNGQREIANAFTAEQYGSSMSGNTASMQAAKKIIKSQIETMAGAYL